IFSATSVVNYDAQLYGKLLLIWFPPLGMPPKLLMTRARMLYGMPERGPRLKEKRQEKRRQKKRLPSGDSSLDQDSFSVNDRGATNLNAARLPPYAARP